MFQKKIILAASDSLLFMWKKNWVSLSIKQNQQNIGSFADKTALETGQWLNVQNAE